MKLSTVSGGDLDTLFDVMEGHHMKPLALEGYAAEYCRENFIFGKVGQELIPNFNGLAITTMEASAFIFGKVHN